MRTRILAPKAPPAEAVATASSTAKQGRPGGVCLTTFVYLSPSPPSPIRLQEARLRIERDENKRLRGLYATAARQVLKLAHADANRRQLHLALLDFYVDIPGLTKLTTQTVERLDATPVLHLKKMAAETRDQLHHDWLEWAKKNAPSSRSDTLGSLSFPELCARYPAFVDRLFDKYENLSLIIHPAFLEDIPGMSCWVGSVGNAGRVYKAGIKVYPEIPVVL